MLAKLIATFALVLTAACDTNLLVSTTDSFTVISPANSIAVIEPWFAIYRPSMIGNNAQTIYFNSSGYTPPNFKAVFQALFYSNCPHATTTLVIQADDSFVALLNGQPIASGSGWTQTFSFKITPSCGLNTLTLTIVNGGGPSGFTCFISQNQDNCYNCGVNAFYNVDRCKCECSFNGSACGCPHALQRWKNLHPACGCTCVNKGYTKCGQNQIFNDRSCRCECLPVLCRSNTEQDPDSCKCRCKAAKCPEGQGWSYSRCGCASRNCPVVTQCGNPKVWDSSSCSCQCQNPRPTCQGNFVFDSVNCACGSVQPNQNLIKN